MKLTSLFACTALTAAALLAPRVAHAQAATDMVRIEVKVDTAHEHKPAPPPKAGAKPDPTQTTDKTLQILISGKPKDPETRTGKWTIYGKSGKDIIAAESGDFKIELPANGQQKVESKKATLTFTPEHYEGGGGGGKGAAKPGKKVEASGTKYVGWGVVVKDGDKTVGEAYDPMGLKAELAKENK